MKTKLKIALLLCLFGSFSCVPGDDFTVPGPEAGEDPNITPNTNLKAVLGTFFQSGEEVVTFQQDLIFEAYVVSSDEAGNFYKELVVQDKAQNPSAGIAIQINLNSYYTIFNFGRKIFVNLKGLSAGENNGVVLLGIANGNEIAQIPQSRVQDFIIRTTEVAEIIPMPIEPIEFNDFKENLYVEITNVQFSDFHINANNPATYASGANDEFDGERLLVSCEHDFPVILSTSTFADFKALELPPGSGSVTGILTRDFYDEKYTIYLNSPEDIHFSSNQRCDPETFSCGLADNWGSNILFKDDFEDQKNNKPIKGNGWTNYVEEGSEAWEGFEASGENASLGRSARMQISGSGDYKTISWLITPKIDFDAQEGEVLQFKSSTSFANNSILKVLLSTDWDGTEENFKKASWKILSDAYIAKSSDFFGDYIPSGKVSLSCAEGSGYIAFKYIGSDLSNYDGIYELDEVIITSD